MKHGHILVNECRECGETAAEADGKEHKHIMRHRGVAGGYSVKKTDHKTAGDIGHHCAERKCRGRKQLATTNLHQISRDTPEETSSTN